MESEPGLNAPATKADIVGILAEFRKGLATKEDLERFATKEDLERFATKEDLRSFRNELKDDIAGVWTDLTDLRRHLSAEGERTRAEFMQWRARTDRRLRRLETRGR